MNVSALINSFLVAHKTLAKLLRMPYGIFQNAIPVILPSSGSIGNNGALTLTTALPAIFTRAYMYFPANAISAGSAAGLYYVVMSSTTAGTIYNNTLTSGEATIPSSPTAFATTGPGAYTQTTASDITLALFTLYGGTLGDRGVMVINQQASHPSNANIKSPKIKIGGVSVFDPGGYTTQTIITVPYVLRNRGATNINVDSKHAGVGNSLSVTSGYRTLDTSTDLTVLYTANLQVATDYFILEGLDAQIRPAT
jgi:hypothetical protein